MKLVVVNCRQLAKLKLEDVIDIKVLKALQDHLVEVSLTGAIIESL